MKKRVSTAIFLLLATVVVAQDPIEEDKVQRVVETFFEGFHARDSTIMKSVFHENPVIQTIGRSKTGETVLVREELQKVLKGIVGIPLKTDFKEVLHDYVIKIDGNMANVWTPYSFYMDETFSHCGVNSFQLLKVEEEWKIIYLIDTRRKEGCEEKKVK
ncbi:nuclear transport factor 2 family protein [Salinimicrobium sediminilitoris]|uniref:nuclear transport factor 2 family protein n=1 Tax=Salinimicrobium sediminilitoris TaxID=2876715 RepID=UPI001E62B596|nr:nuclear transport factor 2 family protein [Salinimicrobium sediminilitoris]MCC8358819.1 nuclear transport factor 2 family protein [Salinimicrobium sediminilitoris]